MNTLEERFVAALDDVVLSERDLAAPVLAATMSLPSATLRSRRPRRRVAYVAAAALLALVATLAISPMRDAVANWFGIGATQIVVDPTLDVSSLSSTSAEVLSGTRVESQQNPLATFEPPEAVYDLARVRGRTYVWGERGDREPLGNTDIGALLTVRSLAGALDTKRVLAEGVPETVRIEADGAVLTGMWFEDAHGFTPGGRTEPSLSTSVLLWTRNGIEFRLEANLDRETMIMLAAGVDQGTILLPPE